MQRRISAGFRNKYWSFRVEQKVFVLFLSKDGGSVRISERMRTRSFDLVVDVAAVVWCLETFQEAILANKREKFFKKYRGSNFVLLAEIYHNFRGAF